MTFGLDPYTRHEGFTQSNTGYPVDHIELPRKGPVSAFKEYAPYLRKREDSTRNQTDNHRWPLTNEMNGSFEQVLRKEIVLPNNYPNPNGKSKTSYSTF
jgi:hypothetical protein